MKHKTRGRKLFFSADHLFISCVYLYGFFFFLIVHEGSELVFMGMPRGLWGVGHPQTGFRVCPAAGTNRYLPPRAHMVITPRRRPHCFLLLRTRVRVCVITEECCYLYILYYILRSACVLYTRYKRTHARRYNIRRARVCV